MAIPQIGNTQHLCLLKLLSDNGLEPVTSGGNVEISAVANADVANTMERGDIDAALVLEPWGQHFSDRGQTARLCFVIIGIVIDKGIFSANEKRVLRKRGLL